MTKQGLDLNTKQFSPYRLGGLYLIRRGDAWYVMGTHERKRYRVSTGCADLASAKRRMDSIYYGINSAWRGAEGSDMNGWKAAIKAMLDQQRYHAKARGIPHKLKPEEVFDLLVDAGFRCTVSGIEVAPPRKGKDESGQRDPWKMSVDRIDTRHGYTIDNVRIVCLAANLAMNEWGYDTMLRLARAVARNASAARPENWHTTQSKGHALPARALTSNDNQ